MLTTGSDRHGGSVTAFLREADPCSDKLPTHVRLGALYARARNGEVAAAAHQLLNDDKAGGELQLHSALLLARGGDFAGVRFLLRAREGATALDAGAAEMALCNCARFPLAALATACLVPPFPDALLEFPDERVRTLDEIREPLARLATHGTLPGRALGTGVVIQRPLRRAAGFRHTGFVLLRGEPRPRLVPFDEGDLLSRDAADAIRAGSSVVAAYAAGPPCEMLLLYVLTGRTDLGEPIAQAALGVDGGDIGVIAAFVQGRSPSYRIVTASGRHRLHSYLPERQQLGGTCIWHPENDEKRPLMMWGSVVPPEIRRRVLEGFRSRTSLDYGVRSRTFTVKGASGGERHEILTQAGQSLVRPGAGNPAEVVYVAPGVGGRGSFFTLEDDVVSDAEASAIIAGWRAANLQAWGVALAAPTPREPKRCVLVRAYDGSCQVRSAEAGALVSFVEKDGKVVYAQELDFGLTGGCGGCMGVGYQPCSGCGAEGKVTCSRCDGARHVACTCTDGKIPCERCSGTGIRSGGNCRSCNGSGRWRCAKCHGRNGIPCGCEEGMVICPWCEGSRLTRCSCGGRLHADIVRRS